MMNGSVHLPANISIANARLPATYEAAKTALANCESIDECQEWANKAEALASYAAMAKDEALRALADRIQARAIRRCGELLKTFNAPGARTDHKPQDGAAPRSATEAAERAGLSARQHKTAVAVAAVPQEVFDSAVEAPKPPTVTKLAERGKKARPKKRRRSKPATIAVVESQHDRDLQFLRGAWDSACLSARKEFLRSLGPVSPDELEDAEIVSGPAW